MAGERRPHCGHAVNWERRLRDMIIAGGALTEPVDAWSADM
jgi:hypothetical protein